MKKTIYAFVLAMVMMAGLAAGDFGWITGKVVDNDRLEYCYSQYNTYQKESCIYGVARDTGDESLCSQITVYTYLKDACHNYFDEPEAEPFDLYIHNLDIDTNQGCNDAFQQLVNINALVTNIGDSVSSEYSVTTYIDNKFQSSGGGYHALQPDENEGPGNVGGGTYLLPGTYTAKIVVEAEGTEENTGNNVISERFEVGHECNMSQGPSGFDLGFQYAIANEQDECDRYGKQLMNINALVKNYGESTSPEYDVYLYIDGQSNSGGTGYHALRPGETEGPENIGGGIFLSEGRYTANFVIDSGDDLEDNTNNNKIQVDFYVPGECPGQNEFDFAMVSAGSSGQGECDEYGNELVEYDFQMMNQGSGASSGYEVRMYLDGDYIGGLETESYEVLQPGEYDGMGGSEYMSEGRHELSVKVNAYKEEAITNNNEITHAFYVEADCEDPGFDLMMSSAGTSNLGRCNSAGDQLIRYEGRAINLGGTESSAYSVKVSVDNGGYVNYHHFGPLLEEGHNVYSIIIDEIYLEPGRHQIEFMIEADSSEQNAGNNNIVHYFLVEDECQDTPGEDYCTDTDNGRDTFTKGTVTDRREDPPSITDYCYNDKELFEHWCEDTGYSAGLVNCENGCYDGACRKNQTVCEDTDGYRNFYTKGKAYGEHQEGNGPEIKWWIDYCVGDRVYDFTCRTNVYPNSDPGDVWADSYNCPIGCEDGACIRETEGCRDTDSFDPYTRGTVYYGDEKYIDSCVQGHDYDDDMIGIWITEDESEYVDFGLLDFKFNLLDISTEEDSCGFEAFGAHVWVDRDECEKIGSFAFCVLDAEAGDSANLDDDMCKVAPALYLTEGSWTDVEYYDKEVRLRVRGIADNDMTCGVDADGTTVWIDEYDCQPINGHSVCVLDVDDEGCVLYPLQRYNTNDGGVLEYYCDNGVQTEMVPCEGGCHEGACTEETPIPEPTPQPVVIGQVTNDRATQQEPYIVSRSNGDLLAVYNHHDENNEEHGIFGSISHDQGETWRSLGKITDSWDDSDIIEDRNGNILLLTIASGNERGLVVMTSRDGSRWEKISRVGPTKINNMAGSILHSSDGFYYVTYSTSSPHKVFVTRSSDLINWDDGRQISYGPENEFDSSIVETEDGVKIIVFNSYEMGGIAYSTSRDGREWTRPRLAVKTATSAHIGLNAFMYNDRPHIMYASGRTLYFSMLDNGEWTRPVVLEENMPFGADADVMKNGRSVGLVFVKEDNSGTRDIFFEETRLADPETPVPEPEPVPGDGGPGRIKIARFWLDKYTYKVGEILTIKAGIIKDDGSVFTDRDGDVEVHLTDPYGEDESTYLDYNHANGQWELVTEEIPSDINRGRWSIYIIAEGEDSRARSDIIQFMIGENAGSECQLDSDCPSGYICEEGYCFKSSESEPECSGCYEDGNCLPIGVRNRGRFCDIDGSMRKQKEGADMCENSYECDSNICTDGQCLEKGVMRQLIDWLMSLFV